MAIRRWSSRALARVTSVLWNAGNHDFCPWANRYVYWLKQPIGWFLVAAVASALVAASITPRAWLVFAMLVVVMLLGVLWPWLSLRGLRAELGFERSRCHEGDEVEVLLSIVNRWPFPVWGLLVECGLLAERDEEPLAATALASVRGWSRTRFHFGLAPPRRATP